MSTSITISDVIKLLVNPNVSKVMMLKIIYQRAKIIGLARLLSSALGTGVIAGSTMVKVPQIRKFLNESTLEQKIKVSEGLSLEGVWAESLAYLIHVFYNRGINNSFVNYGEALLLSIQDILLILLISYYRKRTKSQESKDIDRKDIQKSIYNLWRPILCIITSIIVLKQLPIGLITTLQALNIPLNFLSKGIQIHQNRKLQSTSHLATSTVTANTIGAAIRVLTTLQSFDKLGKNYLLLGGYSISMTLNMVLAYQCMVCKDDFSSKKPYY